MIHITEETIVEDVPKAINIIGIYFRKIYIHAVNIDASQGDRALNWTARNQ